MEKKSGPSKVIFEELSESTTDNQIEHTEYLDMALKWEIIVYAYRQSQS